MKKMNRYTLSLALIALFALPLGVACERKEGPMEEVGEDLDDAVDELKDTADDLGDQLDDAGDKIKDGVEDAKDALDGDGDGGNG